MASHRPHVNESVRFSPYSYSQFNAQPHQTNNQQQHPNNINHFQNNTTRPTMLKSPAITKNMANLKLQVHQKNTTGGGAHLALQNITNTTNNHYEHQLYLNNGRNKIFHVCLLLCS